MTKENPEIITFDGLVIVRISDVGKDFANWLYGQTLPLLEELDDPSDWAYYWDYLRWKNHQPLID